MAVQFQHWHFTVDHFRSITRLGIIDKEAPAELISGRIIKVPAAGSLHAASIHAARRILAAAPDGDWTVRVQKPVRLANDSQTKPDITLLSRRNRGSAYPTAADILLLIEVSDTTLDYDQEVKVPLYAASGIPEVWITDLKGGRIGRFSEPREGRYRMVAHARRGETMASLVLPAIAIAVDDVIQ